MTVFHFFSELFKSDSTDNNSSILFSPHGLIQNPSNFYICVGLNEENTFQVYLCRWIEPSRDQDSLSIFIKKYEIIIKIWQSLIHKSIKSGLWTDFKYVPESPGYEDKTQK